MVVLLLTILLYAVLPIRKVDSAKLRKTFVMDIPRITNL